MATSPLKLRWLPDLQDLQDTTVTPPTLSMLVVFIPNLQMPMTFRPLVPWSLAYHNLNSSQFAHAPYACHTIWYLDCFITVVMRHLPNLEKTTIRLTQADRNILQRLTELTGLKQSQLIRASLRVLLRRVELAVEK